MEGRGGIVSSVAKAIGCHRDVARNAIKKCKETLERQDKYDAMLCITRKADRSSLRKIQPGSVREHLLSVYKERHSICVTTDLMNSLERLDLGSEYKKEESVGKKCVRNTLLRMNFEKQKVKKVPQQTNHPIWCKARYQLAAQLLARFDQELPEPVQDDIEAIIIDREAITTQGLLLSIHQIAWWDEIHIHQHIGENVEYVCVFPKTEKGVYSQTGEIEKKKLVSNCRFFAGKDYYVYTHFMIFS